MGSATARPTTGWLACFAVSTILVSLPAYSTTIRVPADQPTIQAGIDAATLGDVVLVAPGTYTGVGNKNLEFESKDIVVRGESGSEVTTIDCEGSGRAFYLLGPLTAAAVVEGFTIRNGDVGDDPVGGGGIFIAGGAPTITNCRFLQNRAAGYLQNGGGGAISVYNADPTITACIFLENNVTGSGAVGGGIAVHTSHIRISRCRFESNVISSSDGLGGGLGVVWVGSAPPDRPAVIEDCEFYVNEATHGGGAFVVLSKLTGCTFALNRATAGGGAWALLSDIGDCSFTGNSGAAGGGMAATTCAVFRTAVKGNFAAEDGGGIYWGGRSNTIRDCILIDNSALRGGAMAGLRTDGKASGCTIANNVAQIGSGIYLDSLEPATWILENVIISGGSTGEAIRCDRLANAVISCSDVFGNSGGDWVGCIASYAGIDGNIAADPRFCDPEAEDWQICEESPCAPDQAGDCGLIGALDVGCACPIAVEPATWGRIKANYRE